MIEMAIKYYSKKSIMTLRVKVSKFQKVDYGLKITCTIVQMFACVHRLEFFCFCLFTVDVSQIKMEDGWMRNGVRAVMKRCKRRRWAMLIFVALQRLRKAYYVSSCCSRTRTVRTSVTPLVRFPSFEPELHCFVFVICVSGLCILLLWHVPLQLVSLS